MSCESWSIIARLPPCDSQGCAPHCDRLARPKLAGLREREIELVSTRPRGVHEPLGSDRVRELAARGSPAKHRSHARVTGVVEIEPLYVGVASVDEPERARVARGAA